MFWNNEIGRENPEHELCSNVEVRSSSLLDPVFFEILCEEGVTLASSKVKVCHVGTDGEGWRER